MTGSGEVGRDALREKLATHRDLALLSRDLVTVRTDCDLPVAWEDLRRVPVHVEALRALAERYELQRLLRVVEELRVAEPETAAVSAARSSGRDAAGRRRPPRRERRRRSHRARRRSRAPKRRRSPRRHRHPHSRPACRPRRRPRHARSRRARRRRPRRTSAPPRRRRSICGDRPRRTSRSINGSNGSTPCVRGRSMALPCCPIRIATTRRWWAWRSRRATARRATCRSRTTPGPTCRASGRASGWRRCWRIRIAPRSAST